MDVRTAGTLVVVALLACSHMGQARVFQRCELARELRDRLRVPPEQIATWVCIAHRESTYNTAAVGRSEGRDHGLFQISDVYWCRSGNVGGACGMNCAYLLDDDITDDYYTCARRIKREHAGLQGNGFNAWAVYAPHCSGDRAALEARYTADCFGQAAATHVAPQQQTTYPPQRWWYNNVVHYKK